MPKQDRDAPVRPPWLPEEDDRRGGMRRFRRRKPEAGAESLEDVQEEAASRVESVGPSLDKGPNIEPAPPKPAEKANGTTSDTSKYYVPVRKDAPADETPVPEVDLGISRIEAEPEPPLPVIVTHAEPPPAHPPPVEQKLPSVAPPPSEPKPVVSEWPSAASHEPVLSEPVEPPQPDDRKPAHAADHTPGDAESPTDPSDPFTRFSVLEEKLRQAGLDESKPSGRRRRPEAEPEPLAEAVSGVHPSPDPLIPAESPAPTDDATVEPTDAATAPDTEDREPAADTSLLSSFVPQALEPGEDSDAGQVADVVLTGDFEPQPTSQVQDEPSPNAESVAAGGGDEVEERAAALLRRIEAKRAQLDEDLAAFEVPAPDVSTPATDHVDSDEPAPVVAEPDVAHDEPSPAVSETLESDPQRSEPVTEEDPAPGGGGAHHVEPPEPPGAPEQAGVPEPDLSEAESLTAEAESLAPEGESSAAEVESEPPLAGPESEAQSPAVEAVPLTVEGEQPAAEADPNLSPTEPEPAEVSPVFGAIPPQAREEVPEPEEVSVADAARPQRPPGRRLAPPPWQIPTAMQQAPAEAPQQQPAYYIPPPPPAAQTPPAWSPQIPHPPAPPQGPPSAQVPVEMQGAQPVSPHQPPPPPDAQGTWQWVPASPPVQQPPPAPPSQPAPPPQQVPPQGWAPGPPMQEVPVGPAGYVPPPRVTAPPPNYQAPQAYRMPPSLDEAAIINRGRYAPRSGWRRAVHRATGGYVNPGDSRRDREHDDLLTQIRQPILGDYRIAVLSIKGGVGKTTTTLGLGSAFATVRTDRIIAVDANPDRGTLAERVRDQSTRSTVRDLLNDQHINSYADVRNHTRMATSRLEVLASEQDPAVSEAFGEIDYRHTIDILQRYYNIILTDCGTGIMHSAMSGVLDLAHTIVLVSSPAMDAARSASATLDWLMQHGHSGLVREGHVLLSASRPGSAGIKLEKVYEHFEARCKSIHMVPFDPHLAEGADVDFNLLNPETNRAYLELAAAIAENFPRLRAREEWQ